MQTEMASHKRAIFTFEDTLRWGQIKCASNF